MAEKKDETVGSQPGSSRRWTFAESPTTSVRREVPLGPEQVWMRVSDISLPAETSPELQRAEWVGDVTEPGVGARFIGFNARGDLAWSVTCLVTAWEPGRTFAWDSLVDPDADEPEAQSSWRFDIEPVYGGSLVTQSVTLGPGRSGLTWAIRQEPEDESEIIARRLRVFEESMAATLDTLG